MEKCLNLFGIPNKTTDASKLKRAEPKFSDEEYQEYLRLKASRQAQPPLTSSISTACISQSMDIQGPWVIDKGAFDHISGDASLFTSMSSQKFPHLINFANGSNVTSKGIGQISLCPSLTLKSVLFVPNCPFGLISLS